MEGGTENLGSFLEEVTVDPLEHELEVARQEGEE